MSLVFGSKHRYVPLQAADILAYEASKRMRGIDAGRPPRRAWTAIDPDPNRRILTVGRFGSDNMPWLFNRLRLAQEEINTFGHPISFWRDTQSDSPDPLGKGTDVA